MSSPPSDLIRSFDGNGWEECSLFIQNVRTVAWKEGKIRDLAWMADFASIGFSGRALAWYTHLEQDVREDWSKLQAALVDQWLTPNSENGPPDVTIPAAAAPPRGAETSDHHILGILKAVVAGSDTSFYVRRASENGDFSLTEDSEEAFSFRFDPLSSSKLLEYVNDRWYSWIAIHWRQAKPNMSRGSVDYADISTVDSETMKSSRGNPGPFQLAMCRTSPSGEVTLVWRNGKTETSMTVFGNGRSIFPVPDPDAYQTRYPTDKRVILYIQKNLAELRRELRVAGSTLCPQSCPPPLR